MKDSFEDLEILVQKQRLMQLKLDSTSDLIHERVLEVAKSNKELVI